MNRPTPTTPPPLPLSDLRRCANDPEFLQAMETLYDELESRIAVHQPVCTNRGACCRFGEFGHRLFVTGAEVAFFTAEAPGPPRLPDGGDACPYQREGRCDARPARPAGCRIFFCESADADWQPETTEWALSRLKKLHRRFDLPYVYVEWLAALGQAGSI
ncbi:MAG: hypothetical protein GY778_29240 [bacterium]|nr:hypothetical protein [bacterium]